MGSANFEGNPGFDFWQDYLERNVIERRRQFAEEIVAIELLLRRLTIAESTERFNMLMASTNRDGSYRNLKHQVAILRQLRKRASGT